MNQILYFSATCYSIEFFKLLIDNSTVAKLQRIIDVLTEDNYYE
jgi:hypothetical protein